MAFSHRVLHTKVFASQAFIRNMDFSTKVSLMGFEVVVDNLHTFTVDRQVKAFAIWFKLTIC